ncbi:MAG: hypothetical protein CL484_10055 [Acidobacteria bacterium]|nr:hypothetical protein [Acidobacteriota bacterium]
MEYPPTMQFRVQFIAAIPYAVHPQHGPTNKYEAYLWEVDVFTPDECDVKNILAHHGWRDRKTPFIQDEKDGNVLLRSCKTVSRLHSIKGIPNRDFLIVDSNVICVDYPEYSTSQSTLANNIIAVARIPTMHDNRWHDTLAKLQRSIGVTSGDYASHFFSGMDESWHLDNRYERWQTLLQYVRGELEDIIQRSEVTP